MAAPTERYVDPSIAADSGSGTIGDPWGDLQYGLNQVTRDSTNGDRFNIKAGTDEILAAALTLTTYGTPTAGAPLILRGYTSAAGDGGIGGVSTNGFVFWAAAYSFVVLQDLAIAGDGVLTGTLLAIHRDCLGINLEVSNHAGALVSIDNRSWLRTSNLHDGSGVGVDASNGMGIVGCYLKNGSSLKFTNAIVASGVAGPTIDRNSISIDGSSLGVFAQGTALIRNNSILSAGGTGKGIHSRGGFAGEVLNNLVEGFSGSGGIGIYNESQVHAIGYNAAYNNATNYTAGDDHTVLGDNEALGSTPFAKSGSDTFANRATYFAPLDVGNVRGGAYPTALRLDKGAVQSASAGGGGGGGNMSGGLQ